MKNILIIEDNKDILCALSAGLRRRLKGCSILTAVNGARGMDVVESAPVDLIVTDLAMPVMNGYLFIEYVKKHHPSIPVCVMTGGCSSQITDRLRSLGVGRWIEKPFQMDEFLQMVSDVLHLEPRSTLWEENCTPQ
jgi:CheY-like chemotaxis protein